jgi:hypothetical protein
MEGIRFNKSLGHKRTPKKYPGATAWGYISPMISTILPQDQLYVKYLHESGHPFDRTAQKVAAKRAQKETGRSLITGQRFKNKGQGYQDYGRNSGQGYNGTIS